MKVRVILLLTGAAFVLSTAAHAQNPAAADLPSAPSAPQQETQSPTPASPQTATDQPQTQPQSPPAATGSNDDNAPTIVKRVNEVNVVFTVTDKHGRYVRDLKKNDFRIIDDNKPVLEIRSFRSETDLPLEAGLLIDASNSIRDRFKFEQEAAIEFLNQTVRRKYDRAFVVGFDATP